MLTSLIQNKKLAWGLVFLGTAFAAIYIRLYPLYGHLWAPTNEQATLMVVYNIKQTLLNNIHQQSPDIPLPLANHLAEEKLNETLHNQSAQVRQAIERVSAQLAQSNPKADPIYLLESDPYYYYNLTDNIITHGRMADVIKGSKYFNPLMGAPFGYWQPLTIHPYLGVFNYHVLRIFNPDISLMAAVAFTPLLLVILALIAFLIVCGLLGCGPWAALPAVLLFTFAPIYIKRSALGWYDTDPYNMFFPLILLGLLLWNFNNPDAKKALRAGIFFGLSVCLYALIWQGWGFIFFVSLACAACVTALGWYQKDKNLRQSGVVFILTACVATFIAISAVFGWKEFFILSSEGLKELGKFTNKGFSLWPNLFIEVGELKKSSAQSLITDTGGWMLCAGACIGLWALLKNHIKKAQLSLTGAPQTLILLGFLAATLILTSGAERFALFAVIPLSLLAAFGFESLSRQKWPSLLLVAGVIILSVLTFVKAGNDVRTVLTPIFNSTWETALKDIKAKTPPDSIINTWWPPGHFIKAIAQRHVPFDGASLDEGAVGYWISNILLSTNEAHAQGLVRMLNLSGNKPAIYLTETGLPLSQAVALLHAIAPKSKDEARLFLQAYLKPDQIKHLLALTHGGHPHSYLFLYNEMVDDNLVFKFTGGWDFAKIEEINANPQLLKQIPDRNSKAFIDFLWAIAGGPSKYSEALPLVAKQDGKMIFAQGLSIDETTMDATIESPKYGKGRPLSVVYANENQVLEHENADGHLNYTVVLYKDDNHLSARLMDRTLANSIMVKLYFFDAKGLKYFKPLTQAQDLTGRTSIKVFEVLWKD